MAANDSRVLRVNGTIVLDWGNGFRLRITPEGITAPDSKRGSAKGRPGRKPSAATIELIAAMQADKEMGKPGSTQDYLAVLRKADPTRSESAARQVVQREAKRVFGATLGRGKTIGKPRRPGGGRQPNPLTLKLRAKLAEDKAAGSLREASHYVRWMVDSPGVKLGLKGARPIVYRELRQIR